jgi:hypothetical protein
LATVEGEPGDVIWTVSNGLPNTEGTHSVASTGTVTISVQLSGDAGVTYTLPAVTLSGAVGAGVAPGTGKHIVWDAGMDWNGQLVQNCQVRVAAIPIGAGGDWALKLELALSNLETAGRQGVDLAVLPEVGFNLCLATFFGLACSATLSAARALRPTGGWLAAWSATAFVMVFGNLFQLRFIWNNQRI